MPKCVPIKDLRDTAAFDELVANSSEPITVTKNGYDRFTCVKSEDFREWEQAEARVHLLERMLISERERAAGDGEDAFEVSDRLREKYGL